MVNDLALIVVKTFPFQKGKEYHTFILFELSEFATYSGK
jgi:hypothetical protein